MSRSLLQVESATVRFGGVVALDGVDLDVAAGEIVGVVGALGAGKTTLLRVAAGVLVPDGGTAVFKGMPLRRLRDGEAARAGLVLVPAGGGIFPTLTVRENLQLAERHGGSFPSAAVSALFGRFPILSVRPGQLAGSLSGGEQRQLALARAALARPAVLLLDEPLLGLAPQVTTAVAGLIRDLAAAGSGVVVVEERPTAVLGELATRLVGLRLGRAVDAASLERGGVTVGPAERPRVHDRVEAQAVRVPLSVAEKRQLQTLASANGETVGELFARLGRAYVAAGMEESR